MSSKEFAKTLEFIEKIEKTNSSEELSALLVSLFANYGATHILSGTIPSAIDLKHNYSSNLLLAHWPPEWGMRYFNNGYIALDPTIERLQKGCEAFSWDEIDTNRNNNPFASIIMGEASDYALKQGYTINLQSLDGTTIGFSLAGERIEMSPLDKKSISLMANYAILRAMKLQEETEGKRIQLSAREKEALQLAAEGKSLWVIGRLMKISEDGADKHMRSVRSKLGVATTGYAIAEAIRRKIIQ